MTFPLVSAAPASLGLDPQALERLAELINGHLTEGRYPGAQVALARHGKLALLKSFGEARLDPRTPARDDTLWLLYSNTKVITASAVWLLVERGALRFTDPVAMHIPGFEANGKGGITVIQLLTHQGGFPDADVPRAAWDDHDLLARTVCGFTLDWTPGSRVHYHGRAAHWVAAVLIERLTKTDYRAFIRDHVVEPLGLAGSSSGCPTRSMRAPWTCTSPPRTGGARCGALTRPPRSSAAPARRAVAATRPRGPWQPSIR
jgi:CubicO group peptidase (beta-lactamase class C family)